MNFTQGQNEALQAIESLPKQCPNGGGICVINGYAGTGKTTLIKAIAEEAGDILVLAPTGKAALRVRDVAFCRTSTIHRWLYVADEDQNTGDVYFRKKNLLEIEDPGFHSLIIDEASMVNKELWEDVYDIAQSLGLNVILIGDEFQLPPVESDQKERFSVFSPNFPYGHKRVNLTEVLRQTLENPLIKAATALRIGNSYTLELSSLPIVDKDNMLDECIDTWSNNGVIICHQNVTRHACNEGMRKELKRIGGVEDKEPILVTKNNYHLDIFNGEIFPIKQVIGSIGFQKVKDRFQGTQCHIDFIRVELANGDHCIVTQEELKDKANVGFKFIERESRKLSRPIAKKEGLTKPFIPHIHANYGYSLTCHKSQGSEWDNVLILCEPSVKIATYLGRRWLYTALTRAKKNAKLCWI